MNILKTKFCLVSLFTPGTVLYLIAVDEESLNECPQSSMATTPAFPIPRSTNLNQQGWARIRSGGGIFPLKAWYWENRRSRGSANPLFNICNWSKSNCVSLPPSISQQAPLRKKLSSKSTHPPKKKKKICIFVDEARPLCPPPRPPDYVLNNHAIIIYFIMHIMLSIKGGSNFFFKGIVKWELFFS